MNQDPYKYEGLDEDDKGSVAIQPAPTAEEARLAAERAAEYAARVEFTAAYDAARVPTSVIDEDGVRVIEMRVPKGWHVDGYRTESEFIAARCPHVLAAQEAHVEAKSSALQSAADFERSAGLVMTPELKSRIAALPEQVRRHLPKWMRRG